MGVRSTILTRLPYALRTELEQRLVANGFSGYLELTRWLNGLGYRISKGALNRYGLAFEQRYNLEAAAARQARELAATARGDDGTATEALVGLLEERLFSVLIETEKPFDQIDLARLTRMIDQLGRTTLPHRRWVSVRQARLVDQQHAATAKIAAMERGGDLSAAAATTMRSILLSINPFALLPLPADNSAQP